LRRQTRQAIGAHQPAAQAVLQEVHAAAAGSSGALIRAANSDKWIAGDEIPYICEKLIAPLGGIG
jgi:hypothetical protein